MLLKGLTDGNQFLFLVFLLSSDLPLEMRQLSLFPWFKFCDLSMFTITPAGKYWIQTVTPHINISTSSASRPLGSWKSVEVTTRKGSVVHLRRVKGLFSLLSSLPLHLHAWREALCAFAVFIAGCHECIWPLNSAGYPVYHPLISWPDNHQRKNKGGKRAKERGKKRLKREITKPLCHGQIDGEKKGEEIGTERSGVGRGHRAFKSSRELSSLQTPEGRIKGELANTWKQCLSLSLSLPPGSDHMRVTDKMQSLLPFFISVSLSESLTFPPPSTFSTLPRKAQT